MSIRGTINRREKNGGVGGHGERRGTRNKRGEDFVDVLVVVYAFFFLLGKGRGKGGGKRRCLRESFLFFFLFFFFCFFSFLSFFF